LKLRWQVVNYQQVTATNRKRQAALSGCCITQYTSAETDKRAILAQTSCVAKPTKWHYFRWGFNALILEIGLATACRSGYSPAPLH
jgi:hypothetical protein